MYIRPNGYKPKENDLALPSLAVPGWHPRWGPFVHFTYMRGIWPWTHLGPCGSLIWVQFEAHLGTKLMTFPINLEKWQLRFSLERGHQNQAFQGLHFMIFHNFLIRVVETCDCHPPSKALFTLSSIYGPIWHPI